MCKNAAPTVAAEMTAIEPTLINLLTVFNLADTPDGQAGIAAYNAALLAVQNWKQGTDATEVLQLINDFLQIFNSIFADLPLPPEAKFLANVIAAGIQIVIGILTANGTMPSIADNPHMTQKEFESAFKTHIAAKTLASVQVLVPAFKENWVVRARVELGDTKAVVGEYYSYWNKEVKIAGELDSKYAVLAIAA